VRTCSNGGLYSDEMCTCMCVPPYSLDEDGDCTATPAAGGGGSNGENSFASCQVNIDCPWWSNPLILEKCDTGSEIPEGVTELDWTREECCERHHSGSRFCNGSAGGVDTDENMNLGKFEVIPMKFSISNLSDDVDIADLKEQVRTVLKDFLLELSIRFTGAADLGVSSVKETTRFDALEKGMDQVGGIDIYYDVKVIREPEQEFAPTIIEEVIDSYANIVKGIQDNVSKDIYVNICMEGDEANSDSTSPMVPLSLFNRCTLKPVEVTTKLIIKDLPQEIMNNTASFDEIKMVVMEAYKEILTDDDDGSLPPLLSIADKEDVSLGNGTMEVHFNIAFRRGNNGVSYASAVEDKIARSRTDIVDRLQSYTDEDTDWNVNWCTKESALTVCAPGDEALLGGVTASEPENASKTGNASEPKSETKKSFPLWGYITIGSVAGVIVLVCMCRCCKLEGSCCRSRKVSRGRTKKAVRMNQVNMKSYIDTGRAAEKKSSKKSKVYQSRRSKSRRSRGSAERNGKKHRSDMERRHHSSSRSRRRDKQSKGRSSSRSRRSSSKRGSSKRRSRKITNDSDDISISSFDPEKQDDQVVTYEQEQTQELFYCDDNEEEEEQVKREPITNIRSKPDPDGFTSMLTDNNEVLEDDGERLVSFRV